MTKLAFVTVVTNLSILFFQSLHLTDSESYSSRLYFISNKTGRTLEILEYFAVHGT